MWKLIKMICCIPFMVLGAAVGVASECIIDSYRWGRTDFFTNGE